MKITTIAKRPIARDQLVTADDLVPHEPAGPRLAFTVYGAPVPKARPRSRMVNGKLVRPFTPKRTRDWERCVATTCLAALAADGLLNTWPVRARYAVTLRVFRKAARGDADNFQKAWADAVEPILFGNDRFIERWSVEMSVDRDNPRIEADVEVVRRAT